MSVRSSAMNVNLDPPAKRSLAIFLSFEEYFEER